MEWATEPLTNKLIVLYVFLVSAVTIHYRRTVPLPPSRDLTDHSTFFESQLSPEVLVSTQLPSLR
jgi:hypothetical protein